MRSTHSVMTNASLQSKTSRDLLLYSFLAVMLQLATNTLFLWVISFSKVFYEFALLNLARVVGTTVIALLLRRNAESTWQGVFHNTLVFALLNGVFFMASSFVSHDPSLSSSRLGTHVVLGGLIGFAGALIPGSVGFALLKVIWPRAR